jgi:hypothetical protein
VPFSVPAQGTQCVLSEASMGDLIDIFNAKSAGQGLEISRATKKWEILREMSKKSPPTV